MAWNEPRLPVSRRARIGATAWRKTLTEPEKKLWRHLRQQMPLQGTHFRRQVAIGRYVADFCCLGARLIVEVDGEQHGRPEGLARDAERDAFLRASGFRILRFSNADIRRQIEVVLDTIRSALYAEPPPPLNPSPQGGGGLVAP